MFCFLLNICLSFKHYKKTAYFHSRIKLQRSREKPSAPSFAMSQTSWVANGGDAPLVMPVEFQQQVLPLFPTMDNNVVRLAIWVITALTEFWSPIVRKYNTLTPPHSNINVLPHPENHLLYFYYEIITQSLHTCTCTQLKCQIIMCIQSLLVLWANSSVCIMKHCIKKSFYSYCN